MSAFAPLAWVVDKGSMFMILITEYPAESIAVLLAAVAITSQIGACTTPDIA
jgi:hypothetical protein